MDARLVNLWGPVYFCKVDFGGLCRSHGNRLFLMLCLSSRMEGRGCSAISPSRPPVAGQLSSRSPRFVTGRLDGCGSEGDGVPSLAPRAAAVWREEFVLHMYNHPSFLLILLSLAG
jgi:hypothetical protein